MAQKVLLTVLASIVDFVTILVVAVGTIMGTTLALSALGWMLRFDGPFVINVIFTVTIGFAGILAGFSAPILTHRWVRCIDKYSLYQ